MLQIALSRFIIYFFVSRWKDWRDKVATELRQSVRSSTLYSNLHILSPFPNRISLF